MIRPAGRPVTDERAQWLGDQHSRDGSSQLLDLVGEKTRPSTSPPTTSTFRRVARRNSLTGLDADAQVVVANAIATGPLALPSRRVAAASAARRASVFFTTRYSDVRAPELARSSWIWSDLEPP